MTQKVQVTSLLVFLAFITLIVLSPNIRLIPYINWHDTHRIVELALLSLVLIDAAIMGTLYSETALAINKPLRFGLIALLTVVGISTYLSLNPRHGLIEISIFTALCFLSLFVARQLFEDKITCIKHLSYVLWASIFLYVIGSFTGYLAAISSGRPLTWPEPLHGFTVIRALSQFQLVSIALICLPLLIFNLNTKTKRWAYIVLTCWWILLFYGASRGVVLAWLTATIASAAIYKKLAWPLLKIQLINFTSGLIGYLVLFKLTPQLLAPNYAAPAVITNTIIRGASTDYRIELWKAALAMIKDFPAWGVGPMQSYFHSTLNDGTHPHNSVLHLASEWGLIATIITISIVAYCFLCWFKKFNPSKLQTAANINKSLAITLFFSIIASSTYSLVSGVTIMTISQVLLFIIIGLMIGQYVLESTKTGSSPKRKLYLRPILAIVCLITLIFSTLPELNQGLRKERNLASGQARFSLSVETIVPRIWMQQYRPSDWLERVKKEKPEQPK